MGILTGCRIYGVLVKFNNLFVYVDGVLGFQNAVFKLIFLHVQLGYFSFATLDF